MRTLRKQDFTTPPSAAFRVILSDDLLPVQAFFNAIPDRAFLDTLRAFADGVGAVFNATGVEFPREDDPTLRGVQFHLHDEVVVLDAQTFLCVLEHVCDVYVTANVDDSDRVHELLREIRARVPTRA